MSGRATGAARSLAVFAAAALLTSQALAAGPPLYTGINLAGGEFNARQRPGIYGKNYIYPSPADITYFSQQGMNAVRLPVRWERIQHALGAELVAAEMARIDRLVAAAGEGRMLLILDVHNYGKYAGMGVARPEVAAGLADLWRRLAMRYRGRPVAFGIMNEPTGITAPEWRQVVDRVVLSIRKTGARNLLLIPGAYWTGAHSWRKLRSGPSNADSFASFRDPAGNFVFEMHQYLDRNSSGTSSHCVSAEVGAQRLVQATTWLRQVKARAFLGEFGVGTDPTCLAALGRMLQFLERNSDVWAGWTYWAAGPWWAPDYAFSVQPDRQMQKPQMKILRAFSRGSRVGVRPKWPA